MHKFEIKYWKYLSDLKFLPLPINHIYLPMYFITFMNTVGRKQDNKDTRPELEFWKSKDKLAASTNTDPIFSNIQASAHTILN